MSINLRPLTIAVDFDGTIVEDAYPKIGKPMLFAVETLKKLVQEGHFIILWTYRSGEQLEEAVAFCKEKGIELEAINGNYKTEKFDPQQASRKIHADIFIDDRNLGGFPGWSAAYEIIKKRIEFHPEVNGKHKSKKKKWFWEKNG